jgi:hypothetical protein
LVDHGTTQYPATGIARTRHNCLPISRRGGIAKPLRIAACHISGPPSSCGARLAWTVLAAVHTLARSAVGRRTDDSGSTEPGKPVKAPSW